MRLDDERINQIKDCFVPEGCSLPPEQFVQFVSDIEASIAEYENAESDGSSREVKKALARLWGLAQEDDPPIGQIRAAIEKLPKGALEFIERRLAAGTFLTSVTDFRQWARAADASDLVVAARRLSAYGASWQTGRSRGSGRRSGPRLEPTVGRAQRGGRPSNASKVNLIALLAMDWLRATGNEPQPGRDIGWGFGYLVHSVFGWINMLDEDDDSAHHALRQYWEAVEEGRTRTESEADEAQGNRR
jgi:hypothetical protein